MLCRVSDLSHNVWNFEHTNIRNICLRSLAINGVFQCVQGGMVACTLDYDWPTYIVASLIVLFGGLFIMLPVRYVVSRWSSIWSGRLHGCHKHLLNVQEAADVILSGDSLVSKVFVSFALLLL